MINEKEYDFLFEQFKKGKENCPHSFRFEFDDGNFIVNAIGEEHSPVVMERFRFYASDIFIYIEKRVYYDLCNISFPKRITDFILNNIAIFDLNNISHAHTFESTNEKMIYISIREVIREYRYKDDLKLKNFTDDEVVDMLYKHKKLVSLIKDSFIFFLNKLIETEAKLQLNLCKKYSLDIEKTILDAGMIDFYNKRKERNKSLKNYKYINNK